MLKTRNLLYKDTDIIGFSTRPAKNPTRTRNSGSGPVSGLNFESGPGSGLKIKFSSGSKKPGFWKPGSKISGPGRPARCRALVSTRELFERSICKYWFFRFSAKSKQNCLNSGCLNYGVSTVNAAILWSFHDIFILFRTFQARKLVTIAISTMLVICYN